MIKYNYFIFIDMLELFYKIYSYRLYRLLWSINYFIIKNFIHFAIFVFFINVGIYTNIFNIIVTFTTISFINHKYSCIYLSY